MIVFAKSIVYLNFNSIKNLSSNKSGNKKNLFFDYHQSLTSNFVDLLSPTLTLNVDLNPIKHLIELYQPFFQL